MLLRRAAIFTLVSLAAFSGVSTWLLSPASPGGRGWAHAQVAEVTAAGTARSEDEQIRERVLELVDQRLREMRRELAKELDELLALRTQDQRLRARIAELEAENARLKNALQSGRPAPPERPGVVAAEPPPPPPAPPVSQGAFLGVGTAPPTSEVAERVSLPSDRCLAVTAVVENSPAAAIGLRVGDVIVEIGGKPASRENFQQEIAGKAPGDKIQLRYLQLGGANPVRVDARAELANRADFAAVIAGGQQPTPPPAPAPAPPSPPATAAIRLGVTLEEVSAGQLVVVEVADGGNAAVAGMRTGDRLLELGQQKVGTLDEVRAAIKDWQIGQPGRFVYQREQSTKEFIVQLGGGATAPKLLRDVRRVESEPAPPPKNNSSVPFGVMVQDETSGGAGLTVLEVVAGSNAAVAGVQVGDRITQVDDHKTATVDDLRAALMSWRVGEAATIHFTRGSGQMVARVMLGVPGGPSPKLVRSGAAAEVRVSGEPSPRVPPFLGVRLDAAEGGLLIVEVIPSTSAQAMGLRANDILTAINGSEIRSQDDLRKVMEGLKAGDLVKVDVKRGGSTVKLEGTLRGRDGAGAPSAAPESSSGAAVDDSDPARAVAAPSIVAVRSVSAPATAPAPAGRPFVGFELEEAFTDGAVRIVGVEAGGPAAAAGLRVGDRLLQVDGSAGVGLDTFRETLSRRRPADLLVLLIERDGRTFELTVVLGQQ
ncbi:MAG: PDZ domain-containing protein [Planctomycetota bacterium]